MGHCGRAPLQWSTGHKPWPRALTFAGLPALVRPAVVNFAAGVVVALRGRPFSVMGFTVAGDKVVAIDVLADPERLLRVLPAEFSE